MDYLVRYRDGFTIGASGATPDEALGSANAATARPEDTIDSITERHSTATVYDSSRGWFVPRKESRTLDQLVDINTGDVIGVKLADASKVEGRDLTEEARAAAIIAEAAALTPEPDA